MMSGILSPAFLQAAGRAGKGAPIGKIKLFTTAADPTINTISCTGDIKVSTIKNGEPLVQTYSDLSGDTLSIQADANTQIIISGAEITEFFLSNNFDIINISAESDTLLMLEFSTCTKLQSVDITRCLALEDFLCEYCPIQSLDVTKNVALKNLTITNNFNIQTLDITRNVALENLDCQSLYNLQSLDVTKNVALISLYLTGCERLQSLDISKNISMTELATGGCTSIRTVYTLAKNQDVVNDIVDLINNNSALEGTVYVNDTDTYYSDIETAAQNANWTIAPLA